uniref:FAM69 protein-kinase domain-containing protein n=1 Tax=Romanomermis culicivorax TaxID=13658 RepID=A0A915IJT7_ROMCU
MIKNCPSPNPAPSKAIPYFRCDVHFENLGLSASYPKRFLIMDADHVYTDSRMRSFLASKQCKSDQDCIISDCEAIFCKKLVFKLFGPFWSKGNRYLAACHAPSDTTYEQRIRDLRLAWAFSLPDV